jgi:SAM-dependent methyltransferase
LTLSTGDKTYTEAVIRGDYDLYVGNVFGKYDNVRIYWEDQQTRYTMRPHLAAMMAKKRQQQQKVRIVDLGCGAGQGFDLLTQINKRDLDLSLHHDHVLPVSDIDLYLGLDLSQAMVDKGNELFADNPNMRFHQADLRQGLAAIKDDEAPFDVYFSSYGSFSHLSTHHLKNLLQDIYAHATDGSIIVLDLLGRYSIEWPGYWSINTNNGDDFLDYSMSYLQSEFDMGVEVDYFPMRFWTGAEIKQLVASLGAETNATMDVLSTFDRSIMVGRHVDTGEYNPDLAPMRRIVNRLHQDYMRTDLNDLMVDRRAFPQHPVPDVNAFFDALVNDWNLLVEFCDKRLQQNISTVELEGWSSYSAPLQFAMMTMDRVINDTGWMWNGDPRANIIEPQLGYALRSLESSLQKGMGCGHGLLAVLQVNK